MELNELFTEIRALSVKKDHARIIELTSDLDLDKLALTSVERATLLHLVGVAHFRHMNLTSAKENILKSLSLLEDNFQATVDLFFIEHSLGNHEDAVTLIKKLTRRHQSLREPMLYLIAATSARYTGDLILADSYVEEALRLDGASVDAYYEKAAILKAQGLFSDALKYLRVALEKSPENVKVVNQLASVCLSLTKYQEALDVLEDFSGHNEYINWNKGVALAELHHYPEATEIFRGLLRQYIKDQNFLDVFQVHTPVQHHENLEAALLEVAEVLDKANIEFFLVSGTLLGLHRDGKFLKTEKDVDIAIPWATNRYSLISVFEQAGYHLSGTVIAQVDTECMQLTFVSESLKVPVDVFFARKNGEKIEIGLDYEPPLIWHLNPFKLTTQQYFSCNFLVPDPPDVVLCQLYGPDWKTPQHYDPLLLSPALLGVLHPAAIARSYNNLVELLKNKNWKKAISYVKQIQSVHDDSLLVELKNHLINEDLEG